MSKIIRSPKRIKTVIAVGSNCIGCPARILKAFTAELIVRAAGAFALGRVALSLTLPCVYALLVPRTGRSGGDLWNVVECAKECKKGLGMKCVVPTYFESETNIWFYCFVKIGLPSTSNSYMIFIFCSPVTRPSCSTYSARCHTGTDLTFSSVSRGGRVP